MARLLIADDEEMFLIQIREVLLDLGHEIVTASDGVKAFEKIENGTFDLVVTDLRMPGMDGIQLLGKIQKRFPDLPVIVMSGQGTIDLAVSAMKEGAADFLVKPFSGDHLLMVVNKTLRLRNIEEENRALREQIGKRLSFENLIGKNFQMQKIFETLAVVAPTETTVLILGETGTGKSLLAQAIHHHSLRKEKRFVKVDCGALSESLLESELFGHEKGAFTHAYQQRIGRFEYADGGTIFLDEIGEISMALQIKLLRVIEERKIERVGSNLTKKVDVRIIAATNRDLVEEVKNGKFRSDLFYRLNVIPIRIPPLRERGDDIPLLVDHFMEDYRRKLGRKRQRVSSMALQAFMGYPWPGNIRELENVIEKTLLLEKGALIDRIDLPIVSTDSPRSDGTAYFQEPFRESKRKLIDEFEKEYFSSLLMWAGGNISRASKKSGMDYKSFYEKIKRYRLDPTDYKKPS